MNFVLFLALITFLGWGTGDLFTIVAARRIGANITTFGIFLSSFIISLLFLPFAPHSLSSITLPLLLLNIFLGILFVSGNVLISEAYRISSAPLVGIIIQAFPAVVLLLSALIFKDVITPIQLVFMVIILVGVLFCSVDIKKLLSQERIVDRGTVMALVAMVFLSVFFTFSRVLLHAYGWFLPTFLATSCFPIIYLFMRVRREKFILPKEKKVYGSLFMAGLLIRAGDFALNYGLSLHNASSIVAPIASASPVLFVTLSYLIFKDKVTKQHVSGIVVALIGIVFLTVLGK